ncbi:MAG: excisionase family DNA-binding protein [Dehalococcoidia bacterium]|nr:excisionase family DNA-binding protein [Dehalococcoidia bacterium]
MEAQDLERDFLTPVDAAKYLSVHRETLYDVIRGGAIHAFKVGGRWRIYRAEMDRYLHKSAARPNGATLTSSPAPSPLSVPDLPLQSEAKLRSGKRILVIDDSPEIREFFAIVLTKRGHKVDAA